MGWLSGVGVATTGDFYGPDAGASLDQGSVGQYGSLTPGDTTVGSLSNDSGAVTQQNVGGITNVTPGLKGVNPLFFIPLILGFIVMFRILREWGENDGEIKEAKTGLYFGFMASLWSVLLIPLYKALARKYQVHGLSEYIENA